VLIVYPPENGGCEQEFEGAAHREPLVRPMTDALAGSGIHHGNAESATVLALQPGERGVQSFRSRQVGLTGTRKHENGSGKKLSAINHGSGPQRSMVYVQCTNVSGRPQSR
jgi:hypothetical protein